jgi:NAD(P)-dependent dehydrogenase (short-subunit alcohol dehydrogenase family)
VIIATGGASGIGLKFCKLIYGQNTTVWIAGRSHTHGEKAIAEISTSAPTSTGTISFLFLDLSNLHTIKPAAQQFLSQASRLDLFMNNAGVMSPPVGSKTKQGYELQWGSNVVGHDLLTKQLTLILLETARQSPHGDVRVV